MMCFKFILYLIIGFLSYFHGPLVHAITFDCPSSDTQIIGTLQWIQTQAHDTFNVMSRRYGIGYHELREANPGLEDIEFDPGTIIVLPTQFILPSKSRKGIVINLAELRLYHYYGEKINTYPIGIGRTHWDTPLGFSRIIQKIKNPTWYVPKSIREASEKEGIHLPERMPPGPDNPLGPYALRLHYHNYLIHGTNEVEGVGRRSTAGCLRMFPEDAKILFSHVPVNTPVNIVNEPYKLGWDIDKAHLYLEVHTPLEAEENASDVENRINQRIKKATKSYETNISWELVQKTLKEELGIPQWIGSIKKKK